MKKIFYALPFCCLPVLTNAQNLIVNGSAETVPITNAWTIVSGNWTTRSASPLPQSGSNYFFAGANAGAELYQDIDVSKYAADIDAGRQQFAYNGYISSYPQSPPDQSREIVEYRNASGVVLFYYDSQYLTNTSSWQHIAETSRAPKGTRIIRVRLLAKRNSGSNNDGYHDNLSLTALPVPAFAITNKSLKEGNTGTKKMKFIVTLKNATNDTCIVKYNTADSTAIAGQDYVAKSGTLIFPPHATKDSFLVDIIGDKAIEPDEFFLVKLHNPIHAKINKKAATGGILNDDSPALNITSTPTPELKNTENKNRSTIWPNPVSSMLNIRLDNSHTSAVLIQLFNSTGQLVYESNKELFLTQHISLSGIPDGIYILSIKYSDGKLENRKVVVQH